MLISLDAEEEERQLYFDSLQSVIDVRMMCFFFFKVNLKFILNSKALICLKLQKAEYNNTVLNIQSPLITSIYFQRYLAHISTSASHHYYTARFFTQACFVHSNLYFSFPLNFASWRYFHIKT